MQTITKYVEKTVFVADDGKEFSNAYECKRHEFLKTYHTLKPTPIKLPDGEWRYVVKCSTEKELINILDFYNDHFSTDAFCDCIEKEEVPIYLNSFIVLEYKELDIGDYARVYTLAKFIEKIDGEIASLTDIRNNLMEASNERN